MLGKLVVGEIAVGEVVTGETVLGKLRWGNNLTPLQTTTDKQQQTTTDIQQQTTSDRQLQTRRNQDVWSFENIPTAGGKYCFHILMHFKYCCIPIWN